MAYYGTINAGSRREGPKDNTQVLIEHWLLEFLTGASGQTGSLQQIVDILDDIATGAGANTDIVSVGGVTVPTKGSTPVVPTMLVDATGNQIVDFGGADVDDAAFTVASSKGTVMMGVYTTDTVDSGDKGAIAMTAARELKVRDELVASSPMLLHGNYSSPEDGTVVYTSANSLTCSNWPFTVDSTICNIIGVLVTNAAGTVTKYINGHNGISLSATSNVVSILGASPFLNTDTKYRLVIHCQDKGYDTSTSTVMTTPQALVLPRTIDPVPLITAAQTLTTSFADLGFEVDTSGAKVLALWLKLTIQQSQGVQIQFLPKHTSAGTEEYYSPIETQTSTLISLNPEIIQLPDASNLYRIKFVCDGVDPFVQVQVKMTTDGGTDGTIDTAYYTLSYN